MSAPLSILQQILFMALLVAVGTIIYKRINFIRKNILSGKPTGPVENKSQRFKNMMLLAFGQQKMFDKPIVGILHFIIYVAFLIINIEVLEIIIDGFTGKHRIFQPLLGNIYPYLINFFELLALGVVVTCVFFLTRRNVLKIDRFQKIEMKGWPALDANIILVWEIFLMFALFTMNATDSILQGRAAESEYVASHYPAVGTFLVSQALIPLYNGLETFSLIVLERAAWWIHIVGILAFAVYVTYSKHLHIGLAFPNTYYKGLMPKGMMANMDKVTQEVKIMLGMAQDDTNSEESVEEIETFGAKDATDLTWKNLMDAYSCTECGRCTDACPANQTGKLLSPRKIMMDVRDRIEDIGYAKDKQNSDEPFDDGKALVGDYTTKEELMACTTCNACVEACPVGINPLDIILQERRYIAMEESSTPQSWNAMFANIENNQAPWAFPPTDRFKWAEDLQKKEKEEKQDS